MSKIILVAPPWRKRHTFIKKHAEYLQGNLAGIITSNTPPAPNIYNCPCLAISVPTISFSEKIVRRFYGYPKEPSVHLKRRFMRILNNYKPDIVLFEFATLAVTFGGICIANDIPYVIHYHGFDVALAYSNSVYKSELLLVANQASRNIANSKATYTRLETLGITKVVLKYLGVHIPFPQPNTPLATCELKIAHLGSFFDVKNPLGTIKAFEWALNSGLKAKLTMAGTGPLKTLCEEYVQMNAIHNVTFLDTIANEKALELIRSSHLLTQHSVLTDSHAQEGFGVVVAEAMANATAVVVSDHGAFPELVIDGKTGILFPEHDWKAQGKAFLELNQDRDKLRELGLAGYERARDNFSEERERRKLRNILNL